MFKAIIRCDDYRFMPLEKVFSYFTFIPMGKLALNYAGY